MTLGEIWRLLTAILGGWAWLFALSGTFAGWVFHRTFRGWRLGLLLVVMTVALGTLLFALLLGAGHNSTVDERLVKVLMWLAAAVLAAGAPAFWASLLRRLIGRHD